MPKNNNLPHPFLKWAGGKKQLLNDIIGNLPGKFNTYFEPMVGGGAVFFALRGRGLIRRAVISDINEDLINCYRVIKRNVAGLIEELRKNKDYGNDRVLFYKVRASEPEDPVQRCARMIYLNKTCFNGLYRVNSLGKFNVPFGRYRNPKILDEENLRSVSKALRNVKIMCADFGEVKKQAKKGDFVYFDPPYYPLSKTSSFTGYTRQPFMDSEQGRLAEVFDSLDRSGAFVMLSNSDVPFIRGLYQRFNVRTVRARRAINCNGSRRGEINEILVTNY